MKTIVVLSRKGGTGKTTTVHALGAGLIKSGKRVLFVDMDGQANLTLTLGANENELNAYDLLCNGADIKKTIQQTELGDIIAGSELLHAGEKMLDGVNDTYILSNALEKVKKQYDYCVIDTPAALGLVTINCIIAADKIIVPVRADLYSAQGIPRIIEIFEAIQESCEEQRKIDGILVTMLNSRTNISKKIIQDLQTIAKKYHARVYETTIRNCTALSEAQLMQQSIFDYEPRSNGAIDYINFIKESLGVDVPTQNKESEE